MARKPFRKQKEKAVPEVEVLPPEEPKCKEMVLGQGALVATINHQVLGMSEKESCQAAGIPYEPGKIDRAERRVAGNELIRQKLAEKGYTEDTLADGLIENTQATHVLFSKKGKMIEVPDNQVRMRANQFMASKIYGVDTQGGAEKVDVTFENILIQINNYEASREEDE